MKLTTLAALIVVLGTFPCSAQTIATWNVGAAWDGAVEARAARFKEAGEAVKAQVYVLQEVTSLEGAVEIGRLLNVPNAQVVVSDFADTESQRDDSDKANVFFHLEVGVVSSIPILSAVEMEFDRDDLTGPLSNSETPALSRKQLFVPSDVFSTLSPATQRALPFGRGVLKVELEGDIVIYAIHAKSDVNGMCSDLSAADELLTSILRRSDPEAGIPAEELAVIETTRDLLATLRSAEETKSYSLDWIRNAEKREAMFSAVSNAAKRDVVAGKTVLVMGDYNIGINDARSGVDIASDCNPTRLCSAPIADVLCVDKDGLDDSHFLLSSGASGGQAMTALSAGLTETLTGPFSSAIDHVYVAGPHASQFSDAKTFQDAAGGGFGSDHKPVAVTLKPPA